MPAWGFLFSEEDIKNVLQYIREALDNGGVRGGVIGGLRAREPAPGH